MVCINCGREIPSQAKFCSKCGMRVKSDGSVPQPSGSVSNTGSDSTAGSSVVNSAENSFTKRLHEYGASTLFLTGIIMYSAGGLINIFRTFNAGSIFTLAFFALPVIGLWLIYAASKTPAKPEKTLTSVTLFKIPIFINFIGQCALALGLFIVSIVLFILSSSANYYFDDLGAVGIALGFLCLLGMGIFLTFSIIYFKSALNVLNGIRDGIYRNSPSPLRSVDLFTVLMYIGIGFSIISILATAATYRLISGFIYDLLYEIPSEFQFLFRNPINRLFSSSGPSYIFFILVQNVGIILCLITLKQFNNSLIRNKIQ